MSRKGGRPEGGLDATTSSEKDTEFKKIRIPGKRAQLTREPNLREGVEILEVVWQQTAKLAGKIGIPMPE